MKLSFAFFVFGVLLGIPDSYGKSCSSKFSTLSTPVNVKNLNELKKLVEKNKTNPELLLTTLLSAIEQATDSHVRDFITETLNNTEIARSLLTFTPSSEFAEESATALVRILELTFEKKQEHWLWNPQTGLAYNVMNLKEISNPGPFEKAIDHIFFVRDFFYITLLQKSTYASPKLREAIHKKTLNQLYPRFFDQTINNYADFLTDRLTGNALPHVITADLGRNGNYLISLYPIQGSTYFPYLQKLESGPQSYKVIKPDGVYRVNFDGDSLPSELQNFKASPRYDLMKRDQKLSVFVFADTGFDDAKDARETLLEYVAYLRDEKFNVVESRISNSEEWVRNAISSSHLDFIIREGHNSMEFGMAQSGTLVKATKGKNPEKVVYVFLPSLKSDKTVELTFPEIGILTSKRNGQGAEAPVYYVDTKCYSESVYCLTNDQVKNPYFIQITSHGKASTFVNDKSSPLRAMLESFLNENSFTDMRNNMSQARRLDPELSTLDDRYLFPDDSAFVFGRPRQGVSLVKE